MTARPSRAALAAPLLAALLLVATVSAAVASPLTLPQVTRKTLRNGLGVLIVPTARLPLVDFALQVRAGSSDDPPGKEGLAGLTGDLLTQGAGERSARQIADDIAFVGGSLDATTDEERTEVSCEVLQRSFALGLELVHDVATRPTFLADEFDRRKEEALGEIRSALDDPAEVADRALLPFVLGTHALGHPVLGWENTVKGLTRDDVVEFHRRYFRPDDATLVVVGDVNPTEALKAIEQAFKDWKGPGGQPPPSYPPLSGRAARGVMLVSRPEATQSQIRLACPAVARNHPDYFPILVANTILGGGFTSRLVNEIRVNQGLVYGISSDFRMQRNAGEFVISTATRNETLRRTVDATLKVLSTLRADGPTPEEMERAKSILVGQFPLGLQAPDDLADQLLDIEFYGLDPTWLQTFADRVQAVTLDDCRRALKAYFCVEDLKIVVVTNPDVGRAALQGLGPMTPAEPR